VISLWLSTVYLRQHWVVDVLAGFVLAAFAAWIAPLIVRAYQVRRQRMIENG
jgi:membrane-associated phospholipid phosphatase